jgi:hypothetical protein
VAVLRDGGDGARELRNHAAPGGSDGGAAPAARHDAGRAFGDIALQANGYTGKNAGCLGVFELQAEVVQGRPTYKKRGKEEFLFYSTNGCWMVSDDTSETKGWWLAKSGARTPGAITEAWQIHDGSAWVDVRAAKIARDG